MNTYLIVGAIPAKQKLIRKKHKKNRWHKTGTYLPKDINERLKVLFTDEQHEYSRAVRLMKSIINIYDQKKIPFDMPIQIPKNYVKKVLSGHAMHIWTIIKKDGILIKVKNYSTTKHESLEYNFNPDFDMLTKVKVTYYTTKKFSTPFQKKVKNQMKSITLELPFELDVFMKNRIPIIKESVNKKIKGNVYHASNRQKIQIKGSKDEFIKSQIASNEQKQYKQLQAILDQQWRADRNDTNNRLDTNLTNLHGHFIKHLRIDGQTPHFIDLRNSQFVIFANLLLSFLDNKVDEEIYKGCYLLELFYRGCKMCTLSKDIEEFCDLCISGKIYLELAELLDLKKEDGTLDRNEGKRMAFVLFFDQPRDNKTYNKIKARFPNVVKIINGFKNNCIMLERKAFFKDKDEYMKANLKIYKEKKFHKWSQVWKKNGSSKFSIMLQQIESSIFIDRIYIPMMDENKLFSIHDSFMFLNNNTKDEIILYLNKYLPYGYKYGE